MRLLILLLSLSVLALPARAADDLMDVYRLAVENDAQLRAARATRDAAGEVKPQAKAQLLPDVGFAGSVSRERNDDLSTGGSVSYATNQDYAVSLTQPVYRRDRFIQLEQADTRIAQAEAVYATVEQELILRVAEAYFNVLAAEDNLEFAKSEREAIGRQLEQARKRFEVGMIAITDVHEAKAAYDLAEADELAAQNQLDSAVEALKEITGRYHRQLAGLKQEIPLRSPEPADPKQWAQVALKQNLQLKAARYATETARQEIERRRSGHYPTVDVTASHSYRDSTFGGLFPVERQDTSVALELSVPLYQGGLIKSQTREARYRFQQAQEQYEQQRRSTLRQMRDAYRAVETGISRVRALRQAEISNQSALEATEAGFEVGTRTIVDVLLAQRNLFRARRDLAQTRYDYIVNTLRLKLAAGTLSPDDLKKINQWLR